MATTKAKNNSRSKGKNNRFNFEMNKQGKIVILFAISILWLCIDFINANGLWGGMRMILFGIFGFCSFLIPILLIVGTIFFSIKKNDAVSPLIIRVFSVTSIVASIFHIAEYQDGATYWESIVNGYNYYTITDSVFGGGAFGAIFGNISLLFTGGNKVAALIIVLLLLFVLIMLIFKLTLADIIFGVYNPVKKVGKATGNKISEYNLAIEKRNEERKKNFKLDVDLGPDVIEEKSNNKISKKNLKNKEETIQEINVDEENNNESENNNTSSINLDEIIKNNKEKIASNDSSEKSLLVDNKKEDAKQPSKTEQKSSNKRSYSLPPLGCLNSPKKDTSTGWEEELKSNANKLVDALNSFGVETKISDVCRGPSVTRYEIQPAAGVKISRITNLADDIALNLAASGVRIEAPIPNKSAVGIEIPNKNRDMVTLREVIDREEYLNAKSKLNVALGKDIAGNFVYSDICKMPHLLIAGTTGSGKSVCLNSMIVSILYNATPDEVKLIMIDPKQVEFTIYNGIPHLLIPVVADPRKASGALQWAVTEMLRRYKMFSENSVRDIYGYNSICMSEGKEKLPQIVIFIDELSDLMMAAPNEVEDSICRLAQMARAAGMHLVIATQRPSVDVITGIIKANIPSRISLSVSSQVDSRTIIDSVGAEKLLGNGDMLYYPVGIPKPIRVQGCYLSDKEVESVVTYIKCQGETNYDEEIEQEIERQSAITDKKKGSSSDSGVSLEGTQDEELFLKAAEVVIDTQSASTTLLQRKLKLGYARAARIVDELESAGVIGPYEGSKPRKVLMTKQQWLEAHPDD